MDQRHPDWPACTSDAQAFAPALTEAYLMHGVVQGKAVAIGLGRTNEVALGALTDDVVAAAAIERD